MLTVIRKIGLGRLLVMICLVLSPYVKTVRIQKTSLDRMAVAWVHFTIGLYLVRSIKLDSNIGKNTWWKREKKIFLCANDRTSNDRYVPGDERKPFV